MFLEKIISRNNGLSFVSNGILTLGVEIELQLIDDKSFNLAPKFDEILSNCSVPEKLKAEFYLSTAEINTDKCKDVQEVEKDLDTTLQIISDAATKSNLKLATTGCHPFSRYEDCVITPSKRYSELMDRNQWLSKRMTVYGLHVHIGMKSGDDCIRFNNFFLYFLPHLLALSASSPFWQQSETGLSACRPTTYESLPTAGQPYKVADWRDFEHLYQILKKSKAINSLKDLWWDLRPSPNYGTLEIRVCDGPATLAEALAITAFIHLLAHWFNENGSWINHIPAPIHWIARENKWRAIRYGLNAELITNTEGDVKAIKEDILEWLNKLQPTTKKLGYEKYVETLKNIVEKGNSSDRQLKVFNKTNSLEEVVKFNIKEFEQRSPIWN